MRTDRHSLCCPICNFDTLNFWWIFSFLLLIILPDQIPLNYPAWMSHDGRIKLLRSPSPLSCLHVWRKAIQPDCLYSWASCAWAFLNHKIQAKTMFIKSQYYLLVDHWAAKKQVLKSNHLWKLFCKPHVNTKLQTGKYHRITDRHRISGWFLYLHV